MYDKLKFEMFRTATPDRSGYSFAFEELTVYIFRKIYYNISIKRENMPWEVCEVDGVLNLTVLYLGTVLLMYLSQYYHPTAHSRLRHSRRHFLSARSDIYLALAITWLTCFSFLRTSYNDTTNYIAFFTQSDETLGQFLQENQLLRVGKNGLYELYKVSLRQITGNYHVFFLFPALVNTVAVLKLFKYYSEDATLSLVIFHSIGTYVMYIAALKQSLAIATLLLALPYAIERKYVRYYLLVFAAMLFHSHAFVFLAVPFYFGKPWGKVTWLLLGLVLLSMATYDVTYGAFMDFALSIGINVADIEVFDGHSIHPLRVVVFWIPALLAMIFRKRLFEDSTRVENLFTNLSIGAAFILTIGLVQGANLFARMAAYYELAFGISLPWMIHKLLNRRSAELITLLAGGLFFLYFLYEFGVSKDFGNNYNAITLWQFIVGLFR